MNFKQKMFESFGIQLIVTGLSNLVEKEGYTPHQAFELLEEIKNNTFHALSELKEENK